MTLAALAGDDLSVGMLSRIERGLVSPSLATLRAIADRLGVPLASLFAGEGMAAVSAESTTTLGLARALLLLGDPAAASRVALDGADQPGALPERRCRLLAAAAEALLVQGNSAAAAVRIAEASATLPPAGGAQGSAPLPEERAWETALARAEVAWVLALLERRRGQPAAAERCLAMALDTLESGSLDGDGPPPGAEAPDVALLRARALVELASLHEAASEHETARNLLVRAQRLADALADPAATARRLLAPLGPLAGAHRAALSTVAPTVAAPPEIIAGAALAAVAAAARLAARITHELDRLERTGAAWNAAAPPLAVSLSHSRHL
jgi:transcriptional regulator with XRE-family HTH domain